MNPQSFNPEQNPFADLMSRAQPVGQQAPSGMPQQPGMMPGMVQNPNSPELPGQTGDASKPLIMAIKSLHDYIAMSTDIRTQNMVRNLITMLNNLLSKDQQSAAQKAESMSNKGQQEMPQPPQLG